MKSDHNITTQELKQIQLEILKAIHLFCFRNNIKYSLAYGTLLGAVRHGGFIPWDDDIDIVMPRADYNRFIKSFHHNRYKVYSSPEIKEYYLPYAKLVDTSTVLIENSAKRLRIGVNIDIFPLDSYSKSNKTVENWWGKKRRIDKIFNLKMLPFTMKLILKHPRTALYKLYYELRYPYYSLERLGIEIQELAVAFNAEHSEEIGVISSSRFQLKKLLPKKILDEYIDINFEDGSFKCFKDFNEVLKITYGNWEELPPEENRISHHDFKAYWR